jgi:hypothetical protein
MATAEPPIVVTHREQLWYLLQEAAQLEHMIMCQYLYASFSLKTGPDEGLTSEQATAVANWHRMLTGIAVEEMLHFALVCNVMSAIGAAPPVGRPNFPRQSDHLPPGVQFRLLPFGRDSLTHFLYLERPEGMERLDADEFTPARPGPEPVAADEVMPRMEGFSTAGHLYRGIESGLRSFAEAVGERKLFVGPPSAQATPELFGWPKLVAVTDLASARKAIDEIIEQGEGARGNWKTAHYGRFLGIWDEYERLRAADSCFMPARPVIPAFTRQPYDVSEPQPVLSDPATRAVQEIFNLGYEMLLQMLNRIFTHTTETDDQLKVLVGTAFGLMTQVLRPLGSALTTMPAGPEHPGRTAGPAFEMYYEFGNFIPWQEAAWTLLGERADLLASHAARATERPGVSAVMATVAESAASIAASLTTAPGR